MKDDLASTDSFNWMIKRAGQKISIPFQVHSHMLRHAAGYKLAVELLFARDHPRLANMGAGSI